MQYKLAFISEKIAQNDLYKKKKLLKSLKENQTFQLTAVKIQTNVPQRLFYFTVQVEQNLDHLC